MATTTVNIDKPPIPTGKTLWVDAVNGDDATGTTGRQDLPYLTLTAARDAANSGDLVYVRPGAYSITESLAKNGVNWYLDQGCSISKNNGGGLGIFDDDGVAMSFSVYGYGYMECVDDGTDFTRTYGVIATRNAGTKINVAAKALHVEAPQEDPGLTSCCWGFNGDMFVTCDEMTGDYANNIYWENGGMFITCPSLVTNGIASVATIVNDAPTGKLWINAQQIASTNNGAGGVLSCAGTRDDFQVWVTCMEIEGAESSVLVSGGKVYVSAQKITGPILLSDGQSWIKTDKHAGNGRFIECQSGTHFFTSPDIEDNGTATDWIFVSGGDLTVMQSAAVGDAFTTALSGGVLRLKECTIDTSSGVSGVPITKSGGVVELDGCNLIAPTGVDSVSAPTAQTIEARASTANNAVDANVTVEGSLQIETGVASVGEVPIAKADGTWEWGAVSGGSGDVVGPASATDNAIARYDTTTGKLIQNSGITIADGASGTLSGTNTGDQDLSGLAVKANNLSDLSSASTARTNLGLGTAAVVNTGTGGSDVPTITQADARYLRSVIAVLSTTFTTSSAAFVDITGLAVTLDANSTYVVEVMAIVQSSNTATGANVSMTVSGSPTTRTFDRRAFFTPTTAIDSVINTDDGGATTGTTDAANANRPLNMTGLVVTAGSASTIQLRAIRAGSANNISILAGATIIARKVA